METFKVGDLVYVEIVGRRRMCIIKSLNPGYPEEKYQGTEKDYYWVVPFPKEGEEIHQKWVKGDKMEIISESR